MNVKLLLWFLIGFLTQAFFCPGPETVKVYSPELNEIKLLPMDLTSGKGGVLLRWTGPDEGPISQYELYHSFHLDSAFQLTSSDLSRDQREIRIALPDTVVPTLYFSIRAVYVSSTGQRWDSDLSNYGKMTFSPQPTDRQPEPNSYQPDLKTIFRARSTNDRGETFRLILEIDQGAFTMDTTFPFIGRGSLFPSTPVLDSIQLPFLSKDTLPVHWCLVGTQAPGKDILNPVQSMSCSKFFKIRP